MYCIVLYVETAFRFSQLSLSTVYSLDEVDPYQKPAELVELSPKGLVPALRLDNFSPARALNESTVIMDFLEE